MQIMHFGQESGNFKSQHSILTNYDIDFKNKLPIKFAINK